MLKFVPKTIPIMQHTQKSGEKQILEQLDGNWISWPREGFASAQVIANGLGYYHEAINKYEKKGLKSYNEESGPNRLYNLGEFIYLFSNRGKHKRPEIRFSAKHKVKEKSL